MTDLSRGSIRVSIDAAYHEIYKELSEGNDPEKVPFRTMKDVFMLAACLGYNRNSRLPITGSRRQIFHWAQFSEQVDIPIIKSIAIATTEDIQVLTDLDRITQIIEEYANGGFIELKGIINKSHIHPIWNVISICR
jgi:dnd system-associated protein 4